MGNYNGSGGGSSAVVVTAGTGISGVGTAASPLAGIPATSVVPGTMSAADKVKLDTVPTVATGRITVAGAATTTITIPSLTGNTAGDYEVYGCLLLPVNAVYNAISLRPNADAGNAESNCVQVVNTTITYDTVTRLAIASPNTTTVGSTLTFRCRIKSKAADGLRYFEATAYWLDGATAVRSTQQTTGRWTDVTNEITSLVIISNQASGISIGSYVAWRSLGFTA